MSETELLLALAAAAFSAGFVDAVVGGGGLIQLPSLLAAYPGILPATLFGTNKIASIVGTASAAVQYARRVAVPWGIALPGALAALAGAWLGARSVSYLSPEMVRPLVLLLLILVAAYTFARKDFGVGLGAVTDDTRGRWITAAIGGTVGFYDGFFGPGTGSFFIFLLVRFVGLDFLRASVTAKILNVATNIAALSYFALTVPLLWQVAAVMASCNLAGAVLGSRTALRHGAGFVRKIFLLVAIALVFKIALDVIRDYN